MLTAVLLLVIPFVGIALAFKIKHRQVKIAIRVVLLIMALTYFAGFWWLYTELKPHFAEVERIEQEMAKEQNRSASDFSLRRDICYQPSMQKQDVRIYILCNDL